MRHALKLPSVSNVYLTPALPLPSSSVEIEASWHPPAIRAICICYFTRGGTLRCNTAASPHTSQTLKGIENIGMCDELPQITSLQHFHDIVAMFPHYHNVIAALWGCWVGVRMEGCVCVCVGEWGGSAAGIGLLQMSWLIKGSSIKVIEMNPPLLSWSNSLYTPQWRKVDEEGGGEGCLKNPCLFWH